MNKNPFALPTHADRLALLERLQSGASVWAPDRSDPRYRPIAEPVPGDKNPEGKAATRRRKQMARALVGKARIESAFPGVVFDEASEVPPEVWGPAKQEHVVDGDSAPVSPEVAYAAGLAPGKTWNSQP
jgi:hypothetical protein